MATIDFTKDTFETTVASDGITLVDFWAEWCGPCKMFAPVYDKVSEKHPDITFGKVDTEAEQALAAMAGIQAIPTLMFFRDGVLLHRQSGALPEHALEQMIGAIRDVDMEDVRRQMAEAETADAAGDSAD